MPTSGPRSPCRRTGNSKGSAGSPTRAARPPGRRRFEGRYKRTFQVPAAWSAKRVFLVFEGVMTDTQVQVNGQSAGPMHQGGFYRFQYEITSLLKFGQENLLEVTVDEESANASINSAERRADYWNYAGIYRPVYWKRSRPRSSSARPSMRKPTAAWRWMSTAMASAPATASRPRSWTSKAAPSGSRFRSPLHRRPTADSPANPIPFAPVMDGGDAEPVSSRSASEARRDGPALAPAAVRLSDGRSAARRRHLRQRQARHPEGQQPPLVLAGFRALHQREDQPAGHRADEGHEHERRADVPLSARPALLGRLRRDGPVRPG